MKSNFTKDLQVEAEISNFVDRFLYPYVGDRFERQNSREQQKKGIDIILQSDGDTMLIDDKCAFYYANKNLRTFTFELSYENNGVVRKGWLLNPSMSTTHYNVMWLNTKNDKIVPKNITFDDIQEIEAMLISKEKLLSYLNQLGFNLNTLVNMDSEIRSSSTTRRRLTPHIELILSSGIAEQPINIKINKTELSQLAEFHVKVTTNQVLDMITKSVIKTRTKSIIKPAGLEAELTVLSAIKKLSSGSGGHTFLHYPLHKHGYQGKHEIDILTVDRHSGISIIEVKGITINNISSIQGGDWYYTDYVEKKGNPYKQAETQLNLLCKQLEQDPRLFRRFTKRIVVALPYITRSEWEGKGFQSQFINVPPILFKDDLESIEKLKKIEEYYLYKPTDALEDIQWNLMKDFFGIKNDGFIASDDSYSTLYVFPNKDFFQQRITEIERKLKNGIKITILSYFEIDKIWLREFKEYVDSHQLQCFSTVLHAQIKDQIEIQDGEESLPQSILNHFEKFNYEQYQVVHAPITKHLMVRAGAGTGKTHVMIDRILFLLTRKIELEDIIMITFTNESTNEMKKRLQGKLTTLSKLTGNIKYGMYAEDVKEMQISTIHSFSKNILTSLAHEIGYGKNVRLRSFIMEKKKIVGGLIDEYYRSNSIDSSIHLLKHYELVNIILQFWEEMEKKGLSKKEIQELDWGKPLNKIHISLHELFKYVFEHCENRLDEIKKEENAFSMNDLIRKIKEFSNDKEKITQIDHNKYLFMDEFQDSDNVQIDLVASLAKLLNYKLFVVGDVKQSIYRFRGADYKSFDLLDEKVNGQEENSCFLGMSLQQNYRTASSILEKLDSLFVKWGEKDWLTYDMKLIGMNKRKESVNEFQVISINSKQNKDAMISAIQHSLEVTKHLPKKENRKIALIVRTNSQAQEVAEWCRQAAIPTMQNLDGTFYKSDAVRDFKGLLGGLLFPGEAKHVLTALQTPYFRYKIPYRVLLPFSGNNEAILSFINSKINGDFTRYVYQIKTYPVMAVIQKIISEKAVFHHLEEFYQDAFEDEEQLKIFLQKYNKNLFHLLNIIQQQFDMMNTNLYTIYKWLTLQMRTNRKENEPMVQAAENSVDITTVHRSKGLEYHTVIIPKTTSPFDFKRTTFYIEEEDEKKPEEQRVAWFIKEVNSQSSHFDDLEKIDHQEVYKEETRLLYVAMTRVKERLVVLVPNAPKQRTWAELIESTGVKVVPYGR
ncbi:UvrD-helicase domain-containing protein [Heyndrickxia sp. MSNUG]|uniref:UvrD-helicase domain-containing protein n=1 Tax=Heyndrickxia sp. MSNUG TaxID=3136677 RepID=UPI003C2E2AA8